MKAILKANKFAVLLLAVALIFVTSACSKNDMDPDGYDGEWHYDSEYHWRDPDENGDDWKNKHNFVNDVCHLCGYSRKTGTIDPSVKPPDGTTEPPSENDDPYIDDSKPSHNDFGMGETETGADGFSYTMIYGNDKNYDYTYSVAVGNHKNEKDLEIPSEYNDRPVTAISDYGFEGEKALQRITIPKTVTTIGYEAFEGCSALQEIVIPDSVTFIDYRAFLKCTSLRNVTLSKSLKTLNAKTFYWCTALSEIKLPDGIESISKDCFSHCTSLRSVHIPGSLKSLDSDAFFLCPVEEVVAYDITTWMNIDFYGFGSNPLSSGKAALYFNKGGDTKELLTEVKVPDGATEIKRFVFINYKELKSMKIPDTVTKIGMRAFEGCDLLTEIKADGVKDLDTEQFQNMKGLKKVSIMSAETLGLMVFYDCSELEEVRFGSNLKSLGQRCFANTALERIYFDGDETQWEAIFKFGELGTQVSVGDCWNYGVGKYTVHLKGDLTITGQSREYN